MNHRYFGLACSCLTAFLCVMAHGQSSFILTNTIYTAETYTFTNSVGTATNSNGMVVFEGELKSGLTVAKALSIDTGFNLASLQLLAQVKLFDEPLSSSEIGTVQGAVMALKDAPAATTGKYYAWGSSDGITMGWVPLLWTNDQQFAVNDGDSNFITFVFHYPSSGNVTYQVFIGDESASVMEPSKPVMSLTPLSGGITGVSLLGVGGLTQVATAGGPPGPLSTAVGFSVYSTASGFLMSIDTVSENGSAPIIVNALINGDWVEVGRVTDVIGSGDNHYEIYAKADSGLVVGQSYRFKIRDEATHEYSFPAAIVVKAVKMEAVSFEADSFTVSFNSEPNGSYRVIVASSPSAPAADWAAEPVFYPTAKGFSATASDQPFTTMGTLTQVKIMKNRAKAFFKVIKVQ